MNFIRPVTEWPDIICGPILRRVTSESVSVFIALKHQADVDLQIYDNPGPQRSLIGSIKEPTIPIGRKLHVRVITIAINLEPGCLYGYDIKINNSKSLKDIGLLEGQTSLGYDNNYLPVIVLPPTLKDIKIAHGSCRKPHGGGLDAMIELDYMLMEKHDSPLERPHQLFLTGDQIYADDVAEGLLRTLTPTSSLLIGWDETIPDKYNAEQYDYKKSERLAIGQRSNFLSAEACFTSTCMNNHLILWGEYCAMYLMTWCDALWPRNESNNITLFSDPNADTLSFDKETQEVILFAKTISRVRRVLANIPTYMILDDHEVTDDWYLDKAWSRATRKSFTGRRVMRNALLAYAIFQDWGNQPEQYEGKQLGKKLLDSLIFEDSNEPQIKINPSCCDEILDIKEEPLIAKDKGKRIQWDFALEWNEHRVICLDTRTWREYPINPISPPMLISNEALVFQLKERIHNEKKLNIVVSPCPVFGWPIIEDIVQKQLVKANQRASTAEFDNEPWKASRFGFERFIECLSWLGNTVILSGDVHYGFTTEVAYFGKSWPITTPSRMIQLCSSAIKNSDFKTYLLGNFEQPFPFKEIGWMGFEDDLQIIRDDIFNSLDFFTESNELKKEKITKFLYYVYFVHDHFKSPAVIPSGPWDTEQAFNIVSSIQRYPEKEWCYLIRYLNDDRNINERLRGVDSKTSKKSEIILQSALNWFIVGYSNIGIIKIHLDNIGNVESLAHCLLWRFPVYYGEDDPIWIGVETKHIAKLTTPTANERPVFFKKAP